jgi:multidrug efflux pump
MSILSSAVTYYRSTFSILTLILCAGIYSYNSMPVEAQPKVKVPFVKVQVILQGVSPEDSARLLVRPLEQELRTIAGVDELRAYGAESSAVVYVKFEAGAIHSDKAVSDVRVAVDRAKAELPDDAEEPIVEELTADDFPSITVVLTSDSEEAERVMFRTAQLLQREILGIDGVLDANIAGNREEVVEAVVNPSKMENYQITSNDLITAIAGNNLLVPAGEVDASKGRFSVKVPGLIETYQDVYNLPIKFNTQGVVTLGQVADVSRTFKDADSFSTFNGHSAILLEVNKRTEANQIAVARAVRAKVEELQDRIPATIHVDFAFDLSNFSLGLVNEMRGNIITAMVLVMIIVVGALGLRSGILVGLGIPFSLLFSIIGLNFLGFSFNMMVMFGMMLALGMLIDGPIVITEFANRKMAEGLSSRESYSIAVKRMFWPVVASTATTLAAFMPLAFWPGVSGEFMSYLPITVFWVLMASLSYALFFSPVIGSLMKPTKLDAETQEYLRHLEEDDPRDLPGTTGGYARLLDRVLNRSVMWLLIAFISLFSVFKIYGTYNNGVMFFADTEETVGIVAVRAQGNFSIEERRKIVGEVEQRVLKFDEVTLTYSNSASAGSSRLKSKDEIGTILVELKDPKTFKRSTHEVFEAISDATADMSGIIVSAEVFAGGPPVGKPIQIQLESINRDKLMEAMRFMRTYLEANIEGMTNITDTTPLPGIEWEMNVDRALAAQMGVNVAEVGRAVQLVTTGVLLGEFRPDDSTEEVEIRIRYPAESRGLRVLDDLRVTTAQGAVPVSSFVERVAKPKLDKIERIDTIDVLKIQSDLKPGYLADDVVQEIQEWLDQGVIDPEVQVVFRGANEEQENAQAFLSVAFSLALFLMYVLLVTQFNSFYQGFLILSSVIMSTAGVLLGLLITGDVFSTLMTGMGIVALAGIVVNNNIVLIDTYNYERKHSPHLSVKEAIVRACTQRLRPVFLTTATTIFGLLAIALGMSVDVLNREIVVDGVVVSYFVGVARAVVFGLFFSTILTLIVTPLMLVVPERLAIYFKKYVKPLIEDLITRINSLRKD